jgi:sulfur relay (sulfurtransferase) complex TusBCD TusD component (DsrE family)
MPDNHVVVLRSGPRTSEADRALRFAESLLEQGGQLSLALLEDAVLIALKDGELPSQQRLRSLLQAGAGCVYLAEDLTMRGFASDQVAQGSAPASYERLVDVLLADGSRVVGAF